MYSSRTYRFRSQNVIISVVSMIVVASFALSSNAQSIDGKTAPCRPVVTELHPQKLPPMLGKPTFFRGNNMIVDFSLDKVVPNAAVQGRGGITTDDRKLVGALGNCSDSPDGDSAELRTRATDDNTRLTVEIVGVKALGRSGRGWPGVHCTYRVNDSANPHLYADVTDETVPPLNELTGLIRIDDVVYVTVQYNGYAKEVNGKGNLVAAFDLCAHNRLWKSPDLTSNAAMLVHGDYLVTGYGFTSEKRFLFVLNRWSGRVVQKIGLPKSPEELRIHDGRLFVRLYDGYAVFPIENTEK